ncbi:hypothetical protein [Neosynechococcus sphagnicola]|nr:hypothetical protein [Neosynechococcus sphagnicola]
MGNWLNNIANTIKSYWNVTMIAVGALSLLLGIVFVPVPMVPGWPLIILGWLCLNALIYDYLPA